MHHSLQYQSISSSAEWVTTLSVKNNLVVCCLFVDAVDAVADAYIFIKCSYNPEWTDNFQHGIFTLDDSSATKYSFLFLSGLPDRIPDSNPSHGSFSGLLRLLILPCFFLFYQVVHRSRAADPHDPKIWDEQNVFGLSLSIGTIDPKSTSCTLRSVGEFFYKHF